MANIRRNKHLHGRGNKPLGVLGSVAAPEPRWHLGPVAVDLDARGQGIGTAMLEEICHSLDEFRAASYLETDKWENVGF